MQACSRDHVHASMFKGPCACSLIRASRTVNKVVQPYKIGTPWGQPEPVTRHHHGNAYLPAGTVSSGSACRAGNWSSDLACHNYSSPDATDSDLGQVRP